MFAYRCQLPVGHEASEVGPMIAADFPAVLASLVAHAGRVQP